MEPNHSMKKISYSAITCGSEGMEVGIDGRTHQFESKSAFCPHENIGKIRDQFLSVLKSGCVDLVKTTIHTHTHTHKDDTEFQCMSTSQSNCQKEWLTANN